MRYEKVAEWILRIAIAAEFAGHGSFALEGKKQWIRWFAAFGIADPDLARLLLFMIGVVDVTLAVLVLIRPMRLALLWMTFWAFWAALVRPLVGDSVREFIERGANWGAPLALFFVMHGRRREKIASIPPERLENSPATG